VIEGRARGISPRSKRDRLIVPQGSRAPQSIRRVALKRDGNACRLCVGTIRLEVHHMDGRNQADAQPNHALDNLVTLCKRCHGLVHSEQLRLTWEIIERADRVRRGDEVLYVKTDEPYNNSLIGDRRRVWSAGLSTYTQVLVNHPEWACEPGCAECAS
jgi:hypothetical protein